MSPPPANLPGSAEPVQPSSRRRGGLLRWFASNHVAANCLMLLIIGGGVVALMETPVEVFPEVDPDLITITVPYPGASPEEVEQGILLRIEDRISGIDGVKQIRAVASENLGRVIVEIESYARDQSVLNDVKAQVDAITTFPPQAEAPAVALATTRVQVLSVAIYGRQDEHTLRRAAERLRERLTNQTMVSEVELAGVRDFEIWIEIDEPTLRKHHLTLGDVAAVVRASSLDLSAGNIKARDGELLVRTTSQRYRAEEFADIVVLREADGTRVRLGEIARLREAFEDEVRGSFFDGQPAVLLNVFRVGDQSALAVAGAVHDFVEQQRADLPDGLSLAVWLDRSVELRDRISMLTTNAAVGLVLVLICLAVFLDLRLAMWTTLGIPLSFLGAFMIMLILGVSVNMMSLFALVIALGIVVDDAIVVGENIHAHRQRGLGPIEAAVRGVQEMAQPISIAVVTSMLAFAPMIYAAGQTGKVLWPIAAVVIAVLGVSLVEALLVLPAHLSFTSAPRRAGPIARFQQRVRGQLERFTTGPFRRMVGAAVRWRYATVAAAIAILTVVLGVVGGGYVKFAFLPPFDAYYVWATVQVPPGTSPARLREVLAHVESSARTVAHRGPDEQAPPRSPIRHMFTSVGEQPIDAFTAAGPWGAAMGQSGDHVAEVAVELVTSDLSELSASGFADAWRRQVGNLPGGVQLSFSADLFSVGEPVFVELRHRDADHLQTAGERLKAQLAQIEGVADIADSHEPGKLELDLHLTATGRVSGLTREALAQQVRHAFHGAEVQRFQRGRHEVKVLVRYPVGRHTREADLRAMWLRLPDDSPMPLEQAADIDMGRGILQVHRVDRQRVVNVTADVDPVVANANAVNAGLREQILPALAAEFPGLGYTFRGEQQEQAQTLSTLGLNFAVALFAIYALLATQFRSYIQPIIVMLAIPFGLVGAVIGHAIMGHQLSMLSIFGVVALAGVVVNDSLILIDAINTGRRNGQPAFAAVIESAMRRLRPILLTTLTTFVGLAPMIFETSFQGRFLVPMAISLGYGILFATFITLLLVPAVYMIVEDLRRPLTRRRPG